MGWVEEILAVILLKYRIRCEIIGHRNGRFGKLFSKRLTKNFLIIYPSTLPLSHVVKKRHVSCPIHSRSYCVYWLEDGKAFREQPSGHFRILQ